MSVFPSHRNLNIQADDRTSKLTSCSIVLAQLYNLNASDKKINRIGSFSTLRWLGVWMRLFLFYFVYFILFYLQQSVALISLQFVFSGCKKDLRNSVFSKRGNVFHVFPIVFSKQGSAQPWHWSIHCKMCEDSSPWYIYAFSGVEKFHSVIFSGFYKLCKANRLTVEEKKTLL